MENVNENPVATPYITKVISPTNFANVCAPLRSRTSHDSASHRPGEDGPGLELELDEARIELLELVVYQ